MPCVAQAIRECVQLSLWGGARDESPWAFAASWYTHGNTSNSHPECPSGAWLQAVSFII